jgi:hypothetical protein
VTPLQADNQEIPPDYSMLKANSASNGCQAMELLNFSGVQLKLVQPPVVASLYGISSN